MTCSIKEGPWSICFYVQRFEHSSWFLFWYNLMFQCLLQKHTKCYCWGCQCVFENFYIPCFPYNENKKGQETLHVEIPFHCSTIFSLCAPAILHLLCLWMDPVCENLVSTLFLHKCNEKKVIICFIHNFA